MEVLRDHAVDVKDSHNRVTLDSFAALCNKVRVYIWVYDDDDDDDDDVVWSGLRTRSLVVDVKAVALAYVPRRH